MKKRCACFIVAALVSLGLLVIPAAAEDAQADITLPVVKFRSDPQRLALAQSNPQGFLQAAMKNYQSNIRDYTCIFIKQEMVHGRLTPEQEISVKFREQPFSVFMQWTKNPTMIDRVLYVKGANDDQAMVKPAGWLGWFVRTHINRRVDSPDSTKVSRKGLNQFGFGKALKMIIDGNALASPNGELTFNFKGLDAINDRKTYLFERFLPDKACYRDQHMMVHIDQEWLVPIGTFCYDANDRLLGKYIYRDVKLNTGLAIKEFTADGNGL